jgi:hypothetical protein
MNPERLEGEAEAPATRVRRSHVKIEKGEMCWTCSTGRSDKGGRNYCWNIWRENIWLNVVKLSTVTHGRVEMNGQFNAPAALHPVPPGYDAG